MSVLSLGNRRRDEHFGRSPIRRSREPSDEVKSRPDQDDDRHLECQDHASQQQVGRPNTWAAGLTHGGFYRHFGSRDDLVAEAVEAALAHGSKRAEAAARLEGPDALATTIDAYLSPLHRDKPETGCAVAALPADIARGSQRARAAYTAQVRRYLDLFADLTPAGDLDDPHLILAALVGAIGLARAVDDPVLSDEILGSVARTLHRHIQGAGNRFQPDSLR